jgi:hypothetical protein
VETAAQFLRRYTLARWRASRPSRAYGRRGRSAEVVHGDARALALEGPYDGVVTSPPYPGLIDYHELHRYAYELLGLDDRRELEVPLPPERAARRSPGTRTGSSGCSRTFEVRSGGARQS